MKTQRWQDWGMLVLGAWLFFSPFWLNGYASNASPAAWNSYILGVLVVAFAVAALATGQRWEEWLKLAFSVWMVISPVILDFYARENGAAWNQIIVGILIGADAAWALADTRGQQQLRS